jgi:hypothetical protein
MKACHGAERPADSISNAMKNTLSRTSMLDLFTKALSAFKEGKSHA